MTSQIILYIIISAVLALLIVLFMYAYKTKFSNKLKWIFGILRFVTIFLILLLLINPKFRTETYSIKKPNLPILVDNSASVAELNLSGKVVDFVESLKINEEMNKSDEKLFSHLIKSVKNNHGIIYS